MKKKTSRRQGNIEKKIFGCVLYFKKLIKHVQPYLAPNFEFHYFKNYAKLINYVFCKILIQSSAFQKKN